MKYTLMHKNIAVADVEIDEDLGVITSIDNISSREHLPVGVVHQLRHEETVDRYALNHWWAGRSIPASRMGIADALEALGVSSTKQLITKCLGLSLSDHYWLRPYGSSVAWEDVNFFDNAFSDDIGDVLFGMNDNNDGFDFVSPYNTSDGNLQKRWNIIDGKRCLLKSGSSPYSQQPFNEVIATIIMKRLGIDHVPYTVTWLDDKPYSVCEDFVTKDTELIGAWRVLQLRPKANHENEYMHYVGLCKELGVDIISALDRMIVLDYIIANEDRHFNNFGLLRDANSLEWIGAAPIFDSGTSLWYNKSASRFISSDIICKPFKKTHGEQLRLVSSFDWLNISKLNGIEGEILNDLCEDKAVRYVEVERARAIAAEVRKRIDALEIIAAGHVPHAPSSDVGDADDFTAARYD